MQIISRAEAIERGLTRYFTGKPCPKGHVAEHWVNGRACVECRKASAEKITAKFHSTNEKLAHRSRSPRSGIAVSIARAARGRFRTITRP